MRRRVAAVAQHLPDADSDISAPPGNEQGVPVKNLGAPCWIETSGEAFEATQRCPILELPPELRLRIYDLLLSPDELTIISILSSPTELQNKHPMISELPTNHFKAYFLNDDRNRSHEPQLLAVCSQIHGEAKSYLYQTSSLVLLSSCDCSSVLLDSLGRFNIQKLAPPAKLRRLQVAIDNPTESIIQQRALDQTVLGQLRNELLVEYLDMRFAGDYGKLEARSQHRQNNCRWARSFAGKLRVQNARISFVECQKTGVCLETWTKTASGKWRHVEGERSHALLSKEEPDDAEWKGVLNSVRFINEDSN